MRHAWLWTVAVTYVLISTTPATAERNWEFSFGGYGGWAFHGDTTYQPNLLVDPSTGMLESVNAKGTNLRFEDAGTFGAKLSTWYLPKRYRWQPQIGFEIDWTRFTADVPDGQLLPAVGTSITTGTPVGFIGPFTQRREFAVDNMAVNLLFRYPIWATPDMPQGRWHPYIGIGGGAQRARLSRGGYEETSYSPLFQGLVGVKFFLIQHVAVFGEAKFTQGWHTYKYETDFYWERYRMSTLHLVGGVALHF